MIHKLIGYCYWLSIVCAFAPVVYSASASRKCEGRSDAKNPLIEYTLEALDAEHLSLDLIKHNLKLIEKFTCLRFLKSATDIEHEEERRDLHIILSGGGNCWVNKTRGHVIVNLQIGCPGFLTNIFSHLVNGVYVLDDINEYSDHKEDAVFDECMRLNKEYDCFNTLETPTIKHFCTQFLLNAHGPSGKETDEEHVSRIYDEKMKKEETFTDDGEGFDYEQDDQDLYVPRRLKRNKDAPYY